MLLNMRLLGKRYLDSYSGLSASCWRGIIMSFFESMLIGVFYFLTIYFVHDLKMDVATATKIISCYGMGAVFGGYVGGGVADKTSPLIVSVVSLFIQAICYFLLIKLVTIKFLVVNVFILGMASYGFITSNHLSVLNACSGRETQKVKALNLLSTASNLGGGISGIVLGYMLNYGFHKVFVSTSILIFILAVSMVFTRNRNNKHKNIHSGSRNNTLNTNDVTYSPMQVGTVLLSVLLVGAVVAQLGTTYPLYIQKAFPENGLKAVSFLFALNSFMVVLLANPIGEISGKYDKMLMVGFSGCLIGAGMFILNFSPTYTMAAIACVVFTVGEMIFFSIAQYVCYHAGSTKRRGKGLGLFRSVFASSRMLGPMIGGLIYQNAGGEMVWYICGLIGMFSLATCYTQIEKAAQYSPGEA